MRLLISKKMRLIFVTALIGAGLFLSAKTVAQNTEQSPANWSDRNVQVGLQNPDLVLGLQAYTSGDYTGALKSFQNAANHLKGDLAQEIEVKIALCHIFLKDIEKGRSLLESIGENFAGSRGGWQADSMLKRLNEINGASEIERDFVLREEYLLSVGDIQGTHKEYLSLIESSKDNEIREFAQCRVTVLQATEFIMHNRFGEVPNLVKSNLKDLESPHIVWPAISGFHLKKQEQDYST